MEFQPLDASFVPSQDPRGHDIALLIFPQDHELCYEWHFQKRLADGQTALYMCCGCRSLKRADRQAHPNPIPTCHILNGRFITDPVNPRNPHFCEPRSTPRAFARRLIIERCSEIRAGDPTAFQSPTVEVAEVLSRISSDRFRDFTDPERRVMVEQVVQPTVNGRDNAQRVLCRAQTSARRRVDEGLIPGQLDPASCRCHADNESFILLDEPDRAYFGSRALLAAALGRLVLRNVTCDGRYKQIPAVISRGSSSQFYSVLGVFNDGIAIPLLFAFIPDGTEETYRHLFRFFWDIVGGVGMRHALMPPACTFLFDFELPAINAATIEMPIVVKGCFFHYTQAIIRHRDVLRLKGASSKNPVIGVFFRRIQMLPLLHPQFHRVSEALVIPQPPLVSQTEHAALVQFIRYWQDNWGIGGRFWGLWDHSRNVGLRTTNVAEGFHTKLRAAFPRGTPTLKQMLTFIQAQLTIGKAAIGPAELGARPVYIRPREEQRQREIADELQRFNNIHVSQGIPPTTRECKDFLDFLAGRLAH